MTMMDATPLLGVSYRQAKRLLRRFRAQGRKGLVHRSTGRCSNRATPAAYREVIVDVIRTQYGGPAARGPGQRFGPPLVAEHLWADHGILVSVSTLTRWMRAAALWGRVRVMTMVDDATGRTLLRFGAEETTWAAATILQAWIAAYGVPRALYTDWKNVYLRAPTNNERARGAAPLTQFGRMCTKLGITLIGAASPQAKGRVERGHGTHQDRLIKQLRLRAIATVEAANAYVDGEYLPAHNRQFGIAPASATDYHRPRDRRVDADIFCLETTRTIGNDHVVQYEGRALQLDHRARGRVPAKSKVLVRELADGTLRVVHVARDGRERVLPWTTAPVRVARPRRILSASPQAAPQTRWVPAADHPWRSQHRRWKAEATVRRGLPDDPELCPEYAR